MPLLHLSPEFWMGFASCFVLLALIALVLLAVHVPELRNVRWPALPSNLAAPSRARQGRADRAAARRWPHDDHAANEEGELRRTDWRRAASALPWDQARREGGEL